MERDLQFLEEMVKLQNQANQSVNIDWLEAEYPWHRAVWTEAAELVEWTNWKWWCDKPINAEVEKLIIGEAVDIWHFLLSGFMQYAGTDGRIFLLGESIEDSWGSQVTEGVIDYSKTVVHVEDLVERVLDNRLDGSIPCRSFIVRSFSRVCNSLNLSIEGLFIRYAGKNCLNRLRQEYDYKDGLYDRIWDGRDDNDWLTDLQELVPADLDPDVYCKRLSGLLKEKYLELCPQAASSATV